MCIGQHLTPLITQSVYDLTEKEDPEAKENKSSVVFRDPISRKSYICFGIKKNLVHDIKSQI